MFAESAPIDTGAMDTGTMDTGTLDTGVSDTGDTGGGFIGNQLINPSFEDALNNWLVFPGGSGNWAAAISGEGVFGSAELFTAFDGTGALKMFGTFSGGENVTSVYQQLTGVAAGSEVNLSGWAFTHNDDHVSGTTQAYLTVKFFDAGFGFLGESRSAAIDAASPGSTWTELTASGVVPAGTTYVQGVAEYAHCVGAGAPGAGCYDGGSIYFDALDLSVVAP